MFVAVSFRGRIRNPVEAHVEDHTVVYVQRRMTRATAFSSAKKPVRNGGDAEQ